MNDHDDKVYINDNNDDFSMTLPSYYILQIE